MRLNRFRTVSRAGALVGAGLSLGLVAGPLLAKSPYPPLQILLQSGETVLGAPIAYPEGTPKVTAALVTMIPGQKTGWHRHDVPLFAYVEEGELTVDYGDRGKKVYGPGDALLEAVGVEHEGENTGDGPVRLIAVFMGADGESNTVMQAE